MSADTALYLRTEISACFQVARRKSHSNRLGHGVVTLWHNKRPAASSSWRYARRFRSPQRWRRRICLRGSRCRTPNQKREFRAISRSTATRYTSDPQRLRKSGALLSALSDLTPELYGPVVECRARRLLGANPWPGRDDFRWTRIRGRDLQTRTEIAADASDPLVGEKSALHPVCQYPGVTGFEPGAAATTPAAPHAVCSGSEQGRETSCYLYVKC